MGVITQSPGRVLIFVVAYGAEKLITRTFERIPAELFDRDDVHILCIDDASKDRTADVLVEWVRQRGHRNVTVLRNPVNQGYGGNQKLGYRLALEWGFEFVILLHGDGQYAPELLPRFIELWRTTGSDVVLGSRMQSLQAARKGGMPLYKMMGNRVLTSVQNRLAGLGLSEWHTGYRAYSARLLRRVPFEIDTNDFHFDTELLLQAKYVGAKFIEFAIPTHYGDEVCHVNGMRYAKDVLLESLRYRMHCMGMQVSLKYRDLEEPRGQSAERAVRYSAHRMAAGLLERMGPKRVLEIGYGRGSVSAVMEKQGAEVTAVDVAEIEAAGGAGPRLPADPFGYDAVVMLDVVEDLDEPEQFLLALRNESRHIEPGRAAPVLILTTPNVAFFVVRLNLLLGRFNYARRGILDVRHRRLFTRASLMRMLRVCGYDVQRIEPVPTPFEAVMPGRWGRVMGAIAKGLAKVWPRMFAFQWLVVCRPKPGVQQLLAAAQQRQVTEALRVPAFDAAPEADGQRAGVA